MLLADLKAGTVTLPAHKLLRWLPWAAGLIAFSPPVSVGDYTLSLLIYVGLSAIVALGLVVLTGHAGLPSFAQATFVGIGAYVSALLTLRGGFMPWARLPVALLAAEICAWGFALVMVRLSGDYLSLATIALAISVYFLLGGLEVTGGQSGLAGIPGLFAHARWSYWLVGLVVLGLIVILASLLDSRGGRAIRAPKDEAVMAEATGVDTTALKARVFVIACVMAGFSGWFYAYFQRFLNPTAFSLTQGIDYLFMPCWVVRACCGVRFRAHRW